MRTKHGIVGVTEDQSLIGKDVENSKPCVLVVGEELLHRYKKFDDSKMTFDEIID